MMWAEGVRSSGFRFQSSVHSLQVLRSLDQLRQERLLCDVLVKVRHRSFSAHACVLASSSQYFYSALTQHYRPHLTLTLPQQVSVEGFEPLLQFAYTAQLHFTRANISEIQRCAEILGFRDLEQSCFHFILPKFVHSGPNLKRSQREEEPHAEDLSAPDQELDLSSCHATPTSCHATPTSCLATPTSCHTAPTSCHTAPTSCVTAPTSCQAEPFSCHTTPTSCHTAPTSCHAQPTFCHTSPTSCHTTPTSCQVEPADVCPFLSVPLSADFLPDAIDVSSDEILTTPGPSHLTTPGHSDLATPGPSQLTTPGPSHLTTPGLSHLTTPGLSHLTTPGLSHLTTPGLSHLTTPGLSHLTTPGLSHLTTPGPSHLTTPGPSDLATPGPSHLTTPGPSDLATPGPSHLTTPGPSDLATPGPSHLQDCPAPTETSVPDPVLASRSEGEGPEHLDQGFWPEVNSDPPSGSASDFHWLKHLDLGAAPDDCPFLRDLGGGEKPSPCPSPLHSLENEATPEATPEESSQATPQVDLPFPSETIPRMSRRAFLQMLRRESLSAQQLERVQEVRRRSKNRVAAQRCRKRKLDSIYRLEGDIQRLCGEKEELLLERHQLERSIQHLQHSLEAELCGHAPGPSPLGFLLDEELPDAGDNPAPPVSDD